MKVNVNLSRAQGFRQRHVVAWSLPLLLVALALLLRMLVTAEANWSEYHTVRKAADKEVESQNALAAREAALRRKLDEPENRALLREVGFVNYLIDQRQFSIAMLTEKVTALLPPQARLSGLSMPDTSGDPKVQFGIEGTGEEPVETFLTNLENSPDFKDVIVTNQGFEEKGSGAPVSITCNARYVGGRNGLALMTAKITPGPAGGKAERDASAAGGKGHEPAPGAAKVPAITPGASKRVGSSTPAARAPVQPKN